jgi:hypothetical protein
VQRRRLPACPLMMDLAKRKVQIAVRNCCCLPARRQPGTSPGEHTQHKAEQGYAVATSYILNKSHREEDARRLLFLPAKAR